MAIKAKEFLEALDQIETERGIRKEIVIAALQEAMIKGYRKELGGDDADVRVIIDTENCTIEMFEVKKVVDEVEDDFLEISVEDANEIASEYGYEPTFKAGDEFFIPAKIDDLRKVTATTIKSVLRQKLAEAEKDVLYELFKDKIGTMIIGKVEKVNENGLNISVGRTSVYLPAKHMIGDEKYAPGDSIKLFISSVEGNTKGANIMVSRATPDFLRCLFAEEIHEIYDGTIIIKGIARQAGVRSKVAVYSNDPNVDPAGACIGTNGSRIQKIVSQLGNGVAIKEKIDVVIYYDEPALFIMEALKPAKVLGIKVDEETKSAIVVVTDENVTVALGRKAINAKLASTLTGYKIQIKPESQAIEEGLEYASYEEIQARITEAKAELIRRMQEASEEVPVSIPSTDSTYIPPDQRVYEDETNDVDEVLEEVANEEETPVEFGEPVKEEPVSEPEEVNEPVNETPTTEVVTTTTIEDLERKLEEENRRKNTKTRKKKPAKKDEETVEETTPVYDPNSSQNMSIYTEEELRLMDEEELEEEYDEEYEDEDIDYDEFDEYYDDNTR